MHALKQAVRALCVIPFATGLVDMVDGVGLLTLGGARLAGVQADPVLNSQVAFWGAIWFGYGIVLWRASSHIRGEPELFQLLCGILLLSGLARVGAAVAYGLPGAVLTGAMTVELFGGFGRLLWHNALRSRHADLKEF